jgi:hypothetical protein
LGQDVIEETLGDVAGQQPLPVLGEHGGIPHGVIHVQPHEPAEEQVVGQLLHQLPFAADGIQQLHQQGAQELLRGNRGAPRARIQPVELGRQPAQDVVDHLPDRPQRMIRRHPLLGREIAEHGRLLSIVSAHDPLLGIFRIPSRAQWIPCFRVFQHPANALNN